MAKDKDTPNTPDVPAVPAERAIAPPHENKGLEHTRGGATTRDDALDQGVPMLQGDPREPVGPEDAVGVGPTRGDYSTRVEGSPHVAELIPEDELRTETVTDAEGNQTTQIADQPRTRLVPQRSRIEQGEVAGVKGGVGTDPAHPVA